MEMRHEAAAARDEIDDLVRAIHRLERADAVADIALDCLESAQQLEQGGARGEIAAERAEMDPGDRDFLEPCLGDAAHVGDERLDRQAARGAACLRNDAERARLFAAGLRADGERGPPRDAGLDRLSARS